MKNIISMLILCVALSSCVGGFSNQDSSLKYTTYQSIQLNPIENGIQGSIQILQDTKVTPEYRKTWGMSNGAEGRSSLQNGQLRVVGVDGHTVFEEELDAPLGKIKREYLYGTKFPTYFVTVDLGAGMGSYAGPATMLVEIKNGKLLHVQTLEEAETGKRDVWLGDSLKNAWRIVPASSSEGKEIQQVQCHPNFKNPHWADKNEFVVVYTTYRFTDDKWHRFSKERIGFWENEGNWPKRSEFP